MRSKYEKFKQINKKDVLFKFCNVKSCRLWHMWKIAEIGSTRPKCLHARLQEK